MSFPNENNHKTDKCCQPRPGPKKTFHCKSPEMAINGICFTFLSYWITSDLYVILENFYSKNCTKELCKKLFEK